MHPIIRGARDASGSVSTAIPASSSHVRGSPGRVRREAEKGHGGELDGNSGGSNRQQVALVVRWGEKDD